MAVLGVSRVLLAFLALSTRPGSCTVLPSYSTHLKNGSACKILASKFPAKTYISGTTQFSAMDDVLSTWSQTCALSPACLFTPDCAEEVAVGLKIVQTTGTKFSIRSGGHMPVVNAQSNDGGVVFALANLDAKILSQDRTTVSLGPGSSWGDVYHWLSEFGLAVPGGRYPNVGVGGFLIGGGLSFFGNRVGWGASSIVGAEVVLGNGTIVETSRTAHSDLLWALKGGNNNFGIVTRFDVATIECPTVYGGSLAWTGEEATATFSLLQNEARQRLTRRPIVDAVQSFISPGGGIDDPDTEINPSVSVSPTVEGGGWTSFIVPFVLGDYQNSSIPNSVANFISIPNATIDTVYQHANWTEIPDGSYADSTDFRRSFACLSARVGPGLVQLAVDQTLKPALTAMSEVKGASLTVEIEPISKLWLQAARDAGGDSIDLDPDDGSFVIILYTTTWNDKADDETVNAYMNQILDRLRSSLVQEDLYYDFIYINDALDGQKPYPTYGKGKSLPRMKQIQHQYDTQGVIEGLATSGFKLLDV